jgi:hypothetical protein
MQALSIEMKSIVEKAAKFFQRFEGSEYGNEFNLDFGNLFTTLHQRFAKEEKVLYSEFTRIKNSTKKIK